MKPISEDLRARCEAVARRFPKPGAVVAETRAPTVRLCGNQPVRWGA